MSDNGKDRFNRLAAAAASAAGVNGAALLGKPNVLGRLVVAVLDNGGIAVTESDFDPMMSALLLAKASQGMINSVGVQVQMKAKPPGEG